MFGHLVEFLVQRVGGQVTNDVAVRCTEARERLAQCCLASRNADHRRTVGSKTMHQTSAESVTTTSDQCGVSRQIEQIALACHEKSSLLTLWSLDHAAIPCNRACACPHMLSK